MTHAYYASGSIVFNTFGLGNDVPLATTNGGEAITALVDGKIIVLRVPYPAGFFVKNVDGRIDDPSAGWKAGHCGRHRARVRCSTAKLERRTSASF